MIYIIIILLIIGFIAVYNILTTAKNTVKNSKAVIDVYLQQRFDLIPNLVEVTRGYMQHEREVFERIAELRASYNANKDLKTGMNLNNEFANLLGVIEANPDLKSSDVFMKLQKTLDKVESQLQAARRIYNMDVTKYNTKLQIFPLNIVANLFKFKEETLFVLEGEDTVNVKF